MSDIQVLSRTQQIVVDSHQAVSIVNAGPIGPGGPQGIPGPGSLELMDDVDLTGATLGNVLTLLASGKWGPTDVATNQEVDDAIDAHNQTTLAVHGIADTSLLLDQSTDFGGVVTGPFNALTFAVDMATQGELNTVAASLSSLGIAFADHAADTTNVHGITNTANLVYTDDTRLTNSRTPTGAAGGVLSGTYPNPGFAVDMATQAELNAVDTAALHKAGTETVTGDKNFTGVLHYLGIDVETVVGAQAKADQAYVDAYTYADNVFIPKTWVGIGGGVAPLDNNSLIPNAFLPPLAITDTFVDDDESEMLTESAQRGDVSIRTDLSKTFILQGNDPTVLSNWVEMRTPVDAVTSVNGQVGVVNLTANDIAFASATGLVSVLVGNALDELYGDSRFTNQRVPTDGSVTLAKIVAGGLAPSAITGTAVITTDARLSNSRAPNGAAGGVLSGMYPNPGFAPAPSFTGLVSILTGGDNTVGLSVQRTNATQVSNLQEWRDETGAAMTYVSAAGVLNRTASGSYLFNSAVSPSNLLVAGSAAVVPLAFQGAASQTGHLLDFVDSSNTIMSNFSSAGRLTIGKPTVGTSALNVYNTSTTVALFVNTATPSGSSGAGMIGRTDADPTAADQRLGFNLFGSPLGSMVGMAGFSAEAWNSGARGCYMTFETTLIGTSSRSEKMRLSDDGGLSIASSVLNTAKLNVKTDSASRVGQIIRGAASQSADLAQWQDSAGANLVRVSSTDLYITNFVRATGFGSPTSSQAVLRSSYDTGGLGITTAADANKGLVIRRNSATQTANMFEIQNESGSNMSLINKDGSFGIAGRLTSGSTTVSTSARNVLFGVSASDVVTIMRGVASQTGDLQQWQDSASTVIALVDSAGAVRSPQFMSIAASKAYIQTNGDTGGFLLRANADANKGFVVRRNSATQSANLIETQTDTGTVTGGHDPQGRVFIRTTAIISGASLSVLPNASSNIVAIFQGVASQSANLSEWQDSSGTVLASITSAGAFTANGAANFASVKVGINQENSGGRLQITKATTQAATPAASIMKLYVRDGTTVGTLKLVALGPGGVETTIVDNVA